MLRFLSLSVSMLLLVVICNSQDLPNGWSSVELGSGSGEVKFDDETGVFEITVKNEGSLIGYDISNHTGGSQDGLHFMYKKLTGDGYIIADIINSDDVLGGDSNTPEHSGVPIVGVEIRDELTSNSQRFGSFILLRKSWPDGQNDAPKPNDRDAGPATIFRSSVANNNCYNTANKGVCFNRFKKSYFRAGKIKVIREGNYFRAWYYEPAEGVSPMNEECIPESENDVYINCRNKDGVYAKWRNAAWDDSKANADATIDMPNEVFAGITFTDGGSANGYTIDFKNAVVGSKPSPPTNLKVYNINNEKLRFIWDEVDEEYIEGLELEFLISDIPFGNHVVEGNAITAEVTDPNAMALVSSYDFTISVMTGMKSERSEMVKAEFRENDTIPPGAGVVQYIEKDTTDLGMDKWEICTKTITCEPKMDCDTVLMCETVTNVLGSKPSFQPSMRIYPNPLGTGESLISISGIPLLPNDKIAFKLYDMLGHVEIPRHSQSADSYILDLSEFASGLYVVELIQENKVYRNKVLIK